GGKGIELIDHGVDRVLQLQDLALDVHRDFAGEVAFGHRRRHAGDVAHLGGEIAGHQIDIVGQILPGACHSLDLGLAAQLAFGAYPTRRSSDLGGKGIELIDHGVDSVLQLEDLAFDVDGDLAREVAFGHGGGDAGDVAYLGGEIAGHGVDTVGQILPGEIGRVSCRERAQLSVRAGLAGQEHHVGGTCMRLVYKEVDR